MRHSEIQGDFAFSSSEEVVSKWNVLHLLTFFSYFDILEMTELLKHGYLMALAFSYNILGVCVLLGKKKECYQCVVSGSYSLTHCTDSQCSYK